MWQMSNSDILSSKGQSGELDNVVTDFLTVKK